MVAEADVQDTTKLFEVISVTDSEVSTTGGGGVVSPSDVSTGEIMFLWIFLQICGTERTLLLKSTHKNHG